MRISKLTTSFFVIMFLLLQTNPSFAITGKTYLTVAQANPANHSSDFEIDKNIVIKFNNNIFKGRKFNNISLMKQDKKVVHALITTKNNILEIKPSQNLENNAAYLLTIPVNSIYDSKNNSLAADFTIQFTTKMKDDQKSKLTSAQNTDSNTTDSNSADSDLVFSNMTETAVEDMKISPTVRSLHIVNCNITSLDLTEGYENLTSIEIKNSPITSVNMSHGLDHLATLKITDSPITSLELQASLTKLTSLDIVNSPITDMPNLENYKMLKELNLSKSYFTDLDQLSSLTDLTTLNLSGNGIDDISALKGLLNLNSLNLSNNTISNIEALRGLRKLTSLLLSNNDIADYSPVSSYFSTLVSPDFSLVLGQTTPQITKPTESTQPVAGRIWNNLTNWLYNGKSDGLNLINSADKSMRMLSSNDMGKTAVVGDKIYLIGCDGKVDEYDPVTNSWMSKTQIDVLKGTLRFFKLVTINSKIYIVGANFSDVIEYDPATNQCLLKTKLPNKLVVGAVAELNNKIYLFGGYDYTDGSVASSVYEYDPLTNVWTKKKDMPHGASDLRVASLSGKLYTFWINPSAVVGATDKTITDIEGFEAFFVDSQDFVEYDPVQDSWTIKAQANYLRTDAELAAVNGKIIVLGEGFEKNVKFPLRKRNQTIEEYDPALNSWQLKGDMTNALVRWYGTAVYKDELYLFNNGVVLKYSPAFDQK